MEKDVSEKRRNDAVFRKERMRRLRNNFISVTQDARKVRHGWQQTSFRKIRGEKPMEKRGLKRWTIIRSTKGKNIRERKEKWTEEKKRHKKTDKELEGRRLELSDDPMASQE